MFGLFCKREKKKAVLRNLFSVVRPKRIHFSIYLSKVQRPVNVKSRPRLPIPDDEDPYSIAGNCLNNENSDSSGYSGSNGSGGPNTRIDNCNADGTFNA